MNTTQRILPYVRQYVIVAIYEVLEQDRIRYEKTDSSTIVSEISVYGNKSVFSISVSEQADGTQLLVTMVRPHKYLSEEKKGYSEPLLLLPTGYHNIWKMRQCWRMRR